MAPARVQLTIELARAFGVFSAPGVSVERPEPAGDVDLETVHLRRYIAAVRQAGGPEPDDGSRISAWAPRIIRCSRACTTRRR